MKLKLLVAGGRRCAWLAVVSVVLLAVGESAFAGAPGELEQSYLRAAARGELGNVFVVRMFSGYVAFPRTVIQLRTSASTTDYRVNLHRDGSLVEDGSIVRGVFLTSAAGRADVDTGELLPSNPSRSEQIGAIRVEYFDQQGQIVLTRDSGYLEFFGSATVLARDMALTAKALSGPPDKVSRQWEAEPPATPASKFETCSTKALQIALLFHGNDQPVRYRVMSGADAKRLALLGLQLDDMIVDVDGAVPKSISAVIALFHDAASGNEHRFQVIRKGAKQTVLLQPAAARAAFDVCLTGGR